MTILISRKRRRPRLCWGNYNSVMGTATFVPVEEHLSTSYPDGDCEYVDGEIQERNLGEIDHADLQTAAALYLRGPSKGFWGVAVEGGLQVKPRRFGVPDVSVVLGAKPEGAIVK